ncbi:MAG: GntR family transcriptional regulator [Dongiaceae bacterium]
MATASIATARDVLGEVERPIKSVADLAHDQLRREIVAGELVPGEALRQAHIAERLGLSRAPVREALQRLEIEGLAVLRPRRGYVVADLDIVEIADIFEMRIWLEGRASALAAGRRTIADLRALEELIARMDECARGDTVDIVTWAALNREFHMKLFQISGRRQLCRMALSLRDSVERYVRVDYALSEMLRHAQHEHKGIFAALKAGDAERIESLSRAHCEHTRDRLIASLASHQE